MLFPETIMTISERDNFHATLPKASCQLIEPLNNVNPKLSKEDAQPTFTCSKLTTETLEQGVKYVQS